MFSIDQKVFTFHDNCCWLASAIHMAFNNIVKKEIDTDDINNFIINEYNRPLWQSWSPVRAWVNIMIPYIKKRYNIDSTYRVIGMFWKHFNRLLDGWKLIALPIRVTEAYNKDWTNWNKIQWDYTLSKRKWWHWFCVFRKNWEDYLLNSWDPRYNVRKIDLKTKWLFVWTKAYILY